MFAGSVTDKTIMISVDRVNCLLLLLLMLLSSLFGLITVIISAPSALRLAPKLLLSLFCACNHGDRAHFIVIASGQPESHSQCFYDNRGNKA